MYVQIEVGVFPSEVAEVAVAAVALTSRLTGIKPDQYGALEGECDDDHTVSAVLDLLELAYQAHDSRPTAADAAVASFLRLVAEVLERSPIAPGPTGRS